MLLLSLTAQFGRAAAVSSTELLNGLSRFDGQRVTYEGEVIQDLMRRGDHAWVNLNDGQNAIGIWVRAESLRAIRFSGSYDHQGDWVEVTGVFHAACPEHGGDVDLHAEDLSVVQSGGPTPHPVRGGDVAVALASLAATALLLLLGRRAELARRSRGHSATSRKDRAA
jgi:hypothetical protein